MTSRRLAWLASIVILSMSAPSAGMDITRARQGVVRLFVFAADPDHPGQLRLDSTGSGFVINDRGTIVTNNHVIDGVADKSVGTVTVLYASAADAIAGRIHTMDDLSAEIAKLPQASVVDHDRQRDLAILEPKAPGQGAPFAVAPMRLVLAGDRVRAFGYPGLSDNLAPSAYVTMSQPSGEVAAKFRYDKMNVDVFRTTAEIGHGMSGGPLVDECGAVVAINGEGSARSFDEPGQPRGLDVERANYSIVIDALLPMLDKNHIPYRVTSARCVPDSLPVQSTGPVVVARDPVLTGGVVVSLMLGLTAVVMASTRRGRAAVKNATEAVTRSISSKRSAAKPLPAEAGAGAANRAPDPERAQGVPIAREPSGPMLYGLSGEFGGVELELTDESVVLGRDPRVSHLVFSTGTHSVSGRHCSVRFDSARLAVVVEDLWSTNGTFLESGHRLPAGEPTTLKSTDQFYLSDPDILFEVRY